MGEQQKELRVEQETMRDELKNRTAAEAEAITAGRDCIEIYDSLGNCSTIRTCTTATLKPTTYMMGRQLGRHTVPSSSSWRIRIDGVTQKRILFLL